MSTVNDEDGLQHVNQEMEAKVSAPFVSDRFLSPSRFLSLFISMDGHGKIFCASFPSSLLSNYLAIQIERICCFY